LLIEDICKHDTITTIVAQAHAIYTLVMRHQLLLEQFKVYSDSVILIKPCLTRLATHFYTLQRLYKLRQAILQLFASACFETWLSEQSPTDRESAQSVVAEGPLAWFDKVNSVLSMLEPIVLLLRKVDGSTPGLAGKLFYDMYIVQELFRLGSPSDILTKFDMEFRQHAFRLCVASLDQDARTYLYYRLHVRS
jgi:hypothetical protein